MNRLIVRSAGIGVGVCSLVIGILYSRIVPVSPLSMNWERGDADEPEPSESTLRSATVLLTTIDGSESASTHMRPHYLRETCLVTTFDALDEERIGVTNDQFVARSAYRFADPDNPLDLAQWNAMIADRGRTGQLQSMFGHHINAAFEKEDEVIIFRDVRGGLAIESRYRVAPDGSPTLEAFGANSEKNMGFSEMARAAILVVFSAVAGAITQVLVRGAVARSRPAVPHTVTEA